jgi:hypothetical protein
MAGNAGAIRAGKAFVEFVLSDKKIAGQLRRLQKRFTAIGSSLQRIGAIGTAVGGAISAAFGAATKHFISTGDELQKMAIRTGFSVESLSALKYAAGQSGSSIQAVEKGARGLARMMLDADRGLSTAVDNLDDLGISLEELKSLKPEQQFELIASRIAEVDDPSRRAALAMKAFGKSGADLLPLMENGADGIHGLMRQAKELGLVMSDEDAQAAAVLGDTLDDLFSQLKRVVFLVGAAVAGPLTDFVKVSAPILKAVIDWAKSNGKLIRTVAAIGLAIGAIGGTLVATGLGFSLLGAAAGGLASAIGVIGTVFGAIISPIGLAVAAIAGGVTAFAMFTDTGRGMVQSLVQGFGWLKDTVLTSLKAISAALSAGDIAAAGKVLWATLNLLWLEGTKGLRETWHKLTGSIAKVWHTTWAGLQQLANAAMGNLSRGWSHTAEFLTTVWDTAIANVKKAWNSTVAFLQKTWLRIKGLFGADVQGEINRINDELATANKGIDAKAAQSAADRDSAAAANREQSRQQQAAVLDQIGAELAAKLSGADEGTKQRIAAAQQQVEDARSAWKDATAAAEAAGEAAAQQKLAAQEAGNALADSAAGALAGASSRGTFNAINLLAFQSASGGPEEQTAKNTKRIADLQEDLLRTFSLVPVPTF